MSRNTYSDTLSRILKADDPWLSTWKLGSQPMPGIWQDMFPKELRTWNFPDERRASCGHCPKSCLDGYRADYRCCTYLPRVANFLLGLSTARPEAAEVVPRLLSLGLLLPEGLIPAPRQWLTFIRKQEDDTFGKGSDLLCPLLNPQTGHCGIHAFRNAVCATYFCLSDHGELGQQFWGQIQTLGSQLELQLSHWALEAVGFDLQLYLRTLDELAPEIQNCSSASGWREDLLPRLWGTWYGRETELFRACAAALLERRQELWSLASKQPLREPHAFQQALDELDEAFEPVEALDHIDFEDSWANCQSNYQALRRWPAGLWRLNPKVSFETNEHRSAEERYETHATHFAVYRLEACAPPEWRLPLIASHYALLQRFSVAQTLDQALLSCTPETRMQARDYIQEALNQQLLWPELRI